jgi:glycosyltransferase involved in cell wall biosynthesis
MPTQLFMLYGKAIMIDKSVSNIVLTVGCKFNPPKGGIAQVLSIYNSQIFPKFNFVANSCNGSVLVRSFYMIYGFLHFIIKLSFSRQIKIVHIHTSSNHGFLRSSFYIKVSKVFRKKVLIHIHGGGFKDYYNRKSHFVKRYLNMCDGIISLSDSWKHFFTDIVSTNVYVIPNVINEPVFDDSVHDAKQLHLLFLGDICKEKGIFDLVDVISNNYSVFDGRVVMHICGLGNVPELMSVVAENKLDNVVKYEGWVIGKKKIDLLNLCDIFILPSYYEGMPISIIEAMSYRMAIISSAIGGIPELVRNNYNGCLITPGDKDAILNSVSFFIDNPLKIKEFGHNSYFDSLQYLPSSVSGKLNSLYLKMLV